MNRGELRTARELGEQLFTLAQRQQDPALLTEAHYALGLAFFFLGEMVLVREHTEQSIAFYDLHRYHALAFHSVENPRMASLSFAALALWVLGYPDQALKKIHEALIQARELSHPYSLAFALYFAAWLHQFRREGQLAQEQAEAASTLSIDQGFPFLLTFGTCLRGWALAEQGQGEEGIAQIRQVLDAWQAAGAGTTRPQGLAFLAEAYGKIGRTEEGLALLTEALAEVHESGERWWEAELYRLKGELSLKSRQVKASQGKSEGKTSLGAEAGECF